MKNRQEMLGLAANISLIVLLFCFIVAGLNVIGIYSLPAPIEKLLGTYDKNKPLMFDDDSVMQDFADFDENSPGFEEVILGYEDAISILDSLEVSSDYSHKVTVVHIFDDRKRTEFFEIKRIKGLYSVNLFDEKNNLTGTMTENADGTVVVTELHDGYGESVTLDMGNFSMSDVCGFVLTADDFLNSDYELSEAEFSMFTRDEMSFVSVEFNYGEKENPMRQKCVISLDLGVVTEVYSYKDGTAVFEMITQSISE